MDSNLPPELVEAHAQRFKELHQEFEEYCKNALTEPLMCVWPRSQLFESWTLQKLTAIFLLLGDRPKERPTEKNLS